MIQATRSIYEARYTTLERLDLPPSILPFSTLNELPYINSNPGQAPKRFPKIGYLAVGIGSAVASQGANGLLRTENFIHGPADAALFYQVPFVTVPVNADIPLADQARYALRVPETINGQQYISYFLRRLDKTNVQTGLTYISVANGVATPAPWTPSQKDQNPEKIKLQPGVNVTLGDTLSMNAYMTPSLSSSEIAALINAITIRTGDPSYAVLSEFTICSGEDFDTSYTTASGATQSFKEAIAVTPAIHIIGNWPLQNLTDSLTFPMDIGVSEPMYARGQG